MLSDFGYGRLIHSAKAFQGIKIRDPTSGSLRWMAHEVFDRVLSVGSDDNSSKNEELDHGKLCFTKEMDIWALGMVFYVSK